MPSRLALVTAVVVVLAGTAVFLVPPLTREDHGVDATPSPPPVSQVGLVRLRAGSTACLANVVLDAGAQRARFTVGTFGRRGPALHVSVGGHAYAVPAGYADNTVLDLALRPPKHAEPTAFCVADRGRVPIALYGSSELRTRSRVAVTVDGRPVTPDVTLTLHRVKPRSVLGELASVVTRTTRWRPGVATWFVWLLIVVVALGVPGCALFALWRGLAAEDTAQPGREVVGADVADDVAR